MRKQYLHYRMLSVHPRNPEDWIHFGSIGRRAAEEIALRRLYRWKQVESTVIHIDIRTTQ